ncbi:MAG: hypothetical protein WD871_01645 [Xanthobacteraceae bacterium]
MSARPLPEMIRLNARLPRGQDGYWKVIRTLGGGGVEFTASDVDGETNAPLSSVSQYMRRLVRGGFLIERPMRGSGQRRERPYKLRRNPPAEAPRLRQDGTPCPPRKQDQMWRAMRSLRTFTARDLAFAATTPECKVPVRSALRYASELTRAGYLVRTGALGSHAGMMYRLKPGMNTGPLSPVILATYAVFDRNRKEIVGDAADAVEMAS